jgi:cell division protein FtsQ
MKINKPLLVKIAMSILWSAVIVGFFTLWSFAAQYRKQLTCNQIDIAIDEQNDKFFIDKKDVFKIIKQNGYDTLYQKKVDEIDWINLERKIKTNPWIADAQLFTNRNGNIKIEVTQRCPLMRIINKNNVGFYVDENGVPMMLSSKFTAREIIVTGALETTDFNYTNPEKGKRYDIVKFVKFINDHPFWKAQIVQINWEENNEAQLYMLQGSHVIEFGDLVNFEEKLNKLKIFYLEGLNKIGWNKYKVIDVRFKNQVVAIKNIDTKN